MTYSQWTGTPREWKVSGLLFGSLNLIVGNNSSGKSRTLNVISGLGRFLAGDVKANILSGDYDVTFHDGSLISQYQLTISDSKVLSEKFDVGGKTFLDRGMGGEGRICAAKHKDFIDLQTPQDELAAVARRDTIQHP
jgi:hypothetical protein